MIIQRVWRFALLLALVVCCACAEDGDEVSQSRKRSGVEEHARRDPQRHSSLENDGGNESFLPSDQNRESLDRPRSTSGRKIGSASKKSKKNVELLQKLGMAKLKTPAVNHHRKRLASQSRKAQPGDSQILFVKLPPNPYYYAHSKPSTADDDDAPPPAGGASLNNLGVGFNSNGKPARIYHWNIPVMKKMMLARKTSGGDPKSKKQTLWDPAEQRTDDGETDVLHHRVSYYRPKKPGKKTFHKYFAGNGRPHSLYVIEKSKKPTSYKRLLSP